jgi:hypothetical protein
LSFRGCAAYRNYKYSNDFSTLSGAISIAGPGAAFAQVGNAISQIGNLPTVDVTMYDDNTKDRLLLTTGCGGTSLIQSEKLQNQTQANA